MQAQCSTSRTTIHTAGDAAKVVKKEEEEVVLDNSTPALTTASHDTSFAPIEDPFLGTPFAVDDISGISASFGLPSTSYEIAQFTNLKDVVPEWDDEEVDEIVVISPKIRDSEGLSSIHEAEEPASSAPSISSFKYMRHLSPFGYPQSRVSLYQRASTGKLYAIKTFNKSSIAYDTPVLEQAMKEQMMLRLLTQMKMSFILKLRWSFQDNEAMHLVSDYCKNGDLKSYVHRVGPLPPAYARLHAAQLTDALCSLHNCGITHRSLRPDHILLDSKGHILLTGFSKSSVSSPVTPHTGYSPRIGSGRNIRMNSIDVLDEWSAPEAVLGWSQDMSVDCWGFGHVLYFMVTGKHPFVPESSRNQQGDIHPKILENLILYAPMNLNGCAEKSDVRDLISWCLERNPRIRPNAEEIKHHPFFNGLNWVHLKAKAHPVPLTNQKSESTTVDDNELPDSETLHGVYIAGFDYAQDDPSYMRSNLDLTGDDTRNTSGIQDSRNDIGQDPGRPLLLDLNLLAPENVPLPPSNRTTFVEDSADSSMASSTTDSTNTTMDGPSGALYSCTSFGELREAAQGDTLDKVPLPESDFQSNQADRPVASSTIKRQESKESAKTQTGLPHRDSAATPTSILVRRDSEMTISSRPSSRLGARGLGLRKYASLNFELDTIVSLDLDLDFDISGKIGGADKDKNKGKTAGDLTQDQAASARSRRPSSQVISRRVSFADALATYGPASSASADGHLGSTEGASATPKKTSFGKLANPSAISAANLKLRKKRNCSTSALSTTSREKVDLPAGLEQIGLGIGYTYTRPPSTAPPPPPMPMMNRESKQGEVSKKSVSIATSVARCSAIIAQLGRGRNGRSQAPGQSELPSRASEESDALEAVMREMYGTAWNSDTGVGYLSHVPADKDKHKSGGVSTNGGAGAKGGMGESSNGSSTSIAQTQSIRKPGRVYSVVAKRTVGKHDGGSTLRLVDPIHEDEF